MRKCKVHAYLIEVRKLHARSTENLKFENFDGQTHLRAALQKSFLKMKKFSKIPMHQKVFRLEPTWGARGPLTGFIHSGDYGYEGDIIDTDSGETAYSKKKSESLPDPFYFHLELPGKETRGILCLQSWGLSGVKDTFETVLTGVFEKLYPDYRLHTRNLTMKDALADYLKRGVVEEIIVEKHEIPADIADRFGGANKPQPGKFIYTVRPSDSKMFRRDGLLAFSRGEKPLSDAFTFDEHGFDVVKTKVSVGGELKTINLTKPESISSSFDITDDVKIGPKGFPTADSLKNEFCKIVTELAKRGGIELDQQN